MADRFSPSHRTIGRRVVEAAVLGIAALTLIFVLGLGVFVREIARDHSETPAAADGIVVLTGGAGRIEDALELLSEGYGRRLLITGVHERTSRHAIGRLSPRMGELFDCCVDLDYRARNTNENADEIRRWVTQRRFGSVIVVTSDYHLPRALAELDQVLPGVRKLPFSVGPRPDDERGDGRLSRARLILSEYVKFLAVTVRGRIAGSATDDRQRAARKSLPQVTDRPRTG